MPTSKRIYAKRLNRFKTYLDKLGLEWDTVKKQVVGLEFEAVLSATSNPPNPKNFTHIVWMPLSKRWWVALSEKDSADATITEDKF